MSGFVWDRRSAFLATLLLLVPTAAQAQEKSASKFQNAEEAYRAGLRGSSTERQRALEEALRLTNNDALKLKIYSALAPIYRTAPNLDGMIEALDFIITKSEQPAERSLMRTTLLSVVYARGKEKALIARYEERLKDAPNDKTALYILCEAYDRYSPNAERGAEIGKRLTEVLKKEGGKVDIRAAAQLAEQTVRAGKPQEGAELFEEIAPLDPKLSAWYWKEAAQAWLKAKNNERALAAAKTSYVSRPEKRTEQLTYFWHKGLADVFLQTQEYQLAAANYEKALECTDIEGYRRACMGRLAEAREKFNLKSPK